MDKALEVSQVNRIIKDIVDNEPVLEGIKVVGEISSFSITRGTAYFVLKDDESMLNCVMFNCPRNFEIGDKVVADGSIKYYAKGGRLSFNAYHIEPFGQGELYRQFLLLKEKLEKEGLFDEKHKKPIPSYIKRIGVITSKTGAVLQDIINVRTRRNPGLDIVLKDVQVQGVVAKAQIVDAINYFSNYDKVDCVIVARGGGSIEDLQPFNEEDVARAVYNCKLPIISAVGHETDFTIIDFVSDLRAPTPSAAAELVAYDTNELKSTIEFYKSHISQYFKNAILDNEMALRVIMSRLDSATTNIIHDTKEKIINNINLMSNNINNYINNSIYRVQLALSTLDNLNPAKILHKGYSIIKKDKVWLKDYSNIQINDIITIENNKEICDCEVKSKHKKTKGKE